MQKQDKATTEKHAKILREMVRRPENKVCADCKRNDPRWASWNIGVFVCIRCSGVHRSMGTHISKVKSVDLDTWSVEQIQSMQKWGNHRANLYWEAHLRQGHVPPEHKIDSFIRSKYELRRWAMEGAPPSDPSTLENGAAQPSAPAVEAQPAPPPVQAHTSRSTAHGSHRQRHVLHRLAAGSQQGVVTQQPTASAAVTTPPAAPTPAAPAAPAKPVEDLFSLDFHSPPPPSTQGQADFSSSDASAQKKSAKDDIMSLFASSQPQAQTNPSLFAAQSNTVPAANAFASMSNTSLWGAPQSSAPLAGSISQASPANAWGAQAQAQTAWSPAAASYPTAQSNVWGSGGGSAGFGGAATQTNASTAGLFSSSDVWGAPSDASQKTDLFSKPAVTTAKDDAFGDIWGGFK